MLYDGIAVDVLHAELTAKQREESVKRMRKGETWVMVCTEVMARGMDFGGVWGVLNYDFPQSVQSYVHRIGALLFLPFFGHALALSSRGWHADKSRFHILGRTGRAGREGDAITYFTDADAPYLKA